MVQSVLDSLDGDVLLVGHSWGDVVISATGNHEKVKKLLYLSAIVPNTHESAQMALQRHNALMEDLTPDAFGLIRLPTAQAFAHAMGGDLPEQEIAYRFASQQPIHANIFSQTIEQAFAQTIKAQTKTLSASHLAMLSQPKAIADWVKEIIAE